MVLCCDPLAIALTAAAVGQTVTTISRLIYQAGARSERVRISNGESPDVSEIKVVGNDGRNRATTRPDRKVVLAGFADSAGTVIRNIALSLERANAVRQALLRKLGDPQYAKLIDTRGFGPALPVACNENEAGRDKNRRVEVWLK
jgi:hypothetical protein